MFDQAQIQEFKEAFNMIDQDRDGFISKEDLTFGYKPFLHFLYIDLKGET